MKMFQPQDTLDHPCDVTLVVQDGKEFKAHKDVLSKASPFFEKMFNSDMKEPKEGVVRLEMFSESVMGITLKFIYFESTRKTRINRCDIDRFNLNWTLSEEIAQGLIVTADYLFLPNLKSTAEEILLQKCYTSNCISTYYFAELYKCGKLLSKARQLIFANFTAVSQMEEFLNLSKKEVQMWISRDDINISAEEDVFKIILAWINYDKSERKKYFGELFSHVRLVYVSRDLLSSDVVTNDLVRENEGCLDLVEDALLLIDSKNYQGLSVRPRKSLESPFIVVNVEDVFLGYFPREDTWCKIGENSRYKILGRLAHTSMGNIWECPPGGNQLVACHGKLYYCKRPPLGGMLCYDPLSNTWTTLPCTKDKRFRQLFVSNEDEMYALMSLDRMKKYPLYITRYNPESHSWENMSLLKLDVVNLSFVEGMCILAKESFIYFIGGRSRDILSEALKDVYRYDVTKEEADKLADLRIERESACGAWAHEKMFVIGGLDRSQMWSSICEVYDETTDEWQLIGSFYNMRYGLYPKILSADDKLYVLVSWHDGNSTTPKIKSYDPDRDEWDEATEIPIHLNAALERKLCNDRDCRVRVNACSMGVFKELLSGTEVQKELEASLTPTSHRKDKKHIRRRRKCLIL